MGETEDRGRARWILHHFAKRSPPNPLQNKPTLTLNAASVRTRCNGSRKKPLCPKPAAAEAPRGGRHRRRSSSILRIQLDGERSVGGGLCAWAQNEGEAYQ